MYYKRNELYHKCKKKKIQNYSLNIYDFICSYLINKYVQIQISIKMYKP